MTVAEIRVRWSHHAGRRHGAAGLEPTSASGTFSTYLSNLPRNELVHETSEGPTAIQQRG